MIPAASSYIAMNIERESNRIRMRSPTSSTIDWKSSCRARASPISLITASSALRCRVSSIARARVRAEATCCPTKASRSRSARVIGVFARVGLRDEQAEEPAVGAERDAEPRALVAGQAQGLDLTGGHGGGR